MEGSGRTRRWFTRTSTLEAPGLESGLGLCDQCCCRDSRCLLLAAFTRPRETATLTSAWTEFRDCQVLVVGSSLVEFGLSPAVIQEEVKRELGLEICVLNLGQRGLSSESAVSYLSAVLAHSQPEIMIWGTSPQECMMRSQGHYFQTYASPSDVVRACWAVPASFRDAKRAAAAYFRPPALILEGGWLAASLLAGRLLNLAPTRFQLEMARTRKYGGWFPGHPGARGSKAGWESTIHWRSIRELTELADRHHLQLAVLLMPINEEVVKREAGRLHVSYRIQADPGQQETIEMVHSMHARYCPVYRSLEAAIQITTDYTLTVDR